MQIAEGDFKMNYITFMQERERIDKLSVEKQKEFYARVLEEEQAETSVRLEAYFDYAVLFYYEGDFRRTKEILEPFIISYQSYKYTPRMISCFNLIGVASQCEGEFVLSRYFYNLALRVIEERGESHYLAYEYNNIALTYIAEQNYEDAQECIRLAEKYLPQSDEKMGAYVFLNKSDILHHTGCLEESLEAFEISINEYDGLTILPDDTLICGVSLFYALGDREKYLDYLQKIMDKLDSMYASEFIDSCKVVFDCALDSGDYFLVKQIIHKMDDYMLAYPREIKVGLKMEELKYTYGKKTGNQTAMLAALEKKNQYYEQIVHTLEEQRTTSIEEYLETHKHLQEAVQNATQANHAKTQFLANMSHDIRTPMNAIVGITSLMEHSLDDPEKLQNYLSKIRRSSRYMLGLVNDLLDMNKIESGTARLSQEPMKLAEQVDQVNDIIRTHTSERGQHFEIHTHHVCHENLIGDAVRLRQILLNILSNSVKYTHHGGNIQLTIEELPLASSTKAQYHFVITDTGIGMEPELVAHIFEPFIRGEDSMVNKIQGSGLGMAITKNIVDLMNGEIVVDSHPGIGTKVEITLTFQIDTIEDSKAEQLNLLLLSREDALVDDLTYASRIKPVTLTCVSDLESALLALSESSADVLLLSEEFCGDTVLQELRHAVGNGVLFFQVEDTNNSQPQNLPVSRELNGRLSSPFFFTNLEKERNRIRSGGTGNAAGESVLNGMHFLCAEDNELNAEILSAILEIAGASCTVYPNGADLVRAFEQVKPGDYDAILMDVQMPVMNGYEATRAIRQGKNPLGRTIPIIAMTANAFADDVRNSLASGMNAHISKPIDMAILEKTMRRIK